MISFQWRNWEVEVQWPVCVSILYKTISFRRPVSIFKTVPWRGTQVLVGPSVSSPRPNTTLTGKQAEVLFGTGHKGIESSDARLLRSAEQFKALYGSPRGTVSSDREGGSTCP